MDGVAQLASASFLFYFVVSCQSSGPTLGVVTSIYLACLTAVAILSALGAVSDDHLSLDGTALHNNFQIWRVWTCFFWVDGLGIGYALQLWFFGAYSTLVEQHFAGAEIRYVVVLGAGALQILLLTTVIGTGSVLSLAHALCFYVIGLWSRFEQNRSCSFFKLSHVPAASMPWCLLALGIPITGIGNAMYNVVGICAALGYECLIGLTPVPPDTSKPHSQSLHATRRSHNKAGSEPMSRSTSATGRERCIRFGHVAFAMLIAIYNFRNQSVDVRTERSAGVKLCKRMHEAMDATAPRMSQLMSKFAESLSMTADAESIFLVWTFAAEHWQQSLAQKQSQVNVNQMGALDPEVTRQAVVQALRGGEVTEDMSDADVLKEVYRLMGINRLLITADARPYFLTAIASYREQRAHYLLACGQIKRFVLHHEALNVDQSVGDDDIYEAMNTFLTEYDLPGRMSDEAILVELFTLLELPLDAASFKIDEALRDAIRRHRKQRATVASHTLSQVLVDVVAAVHECSSAPDTSLSASQIREEMLNASACNQTLTTLLPKALSLIEGPTNATDEEVWIKLLALANVSTDWPISSDDEGRQPDNVTLFRAAFRRARQRQAAEARAQVVFEELVSTIKAEDPTLAADEEKKAEALRWYQLKRFQMLGAVILRSAELGGNVAVAAPDLARRDEDSMLVEYHQANSRTQFSTIESERAAVASVDEGTPTVEKLAGWAVERSALRDILTARVSHVATVESEHKESKKHEHYARLLKLPRLIDETLSSWIDPAETLSDKQIFQELLRLMGLPDVVEPRLMRAAIEAVKQHRLHREREEMERGDWSDLSAEPLSLRAGWRSAYPTLRSVNTLINVGGDGNDFALFVSAVLQAIGARVRLSVGCSKNATLLDAEPRTSSWASAAMQAKLAATWRTDGIQVCQMFAEVRLGRDPSKIKAWVRAWLPGSKWLGKAYHYRLDQEGFVWLNLDWVDGSRLQRPGVPFKDFDWTTTYYMAEKSCARNSDLVGLHDTEHGSSHSLALHIGGR